MDGQVNEQDLEGVAFIREHRSLLNRFLVVAERARDAELFRERVAKLERERAEARSRHATLEQRHGEAHARCESLTRDLRSSEQARQRLTQDLQQFKEANQGLYERLTAAQDQANELIAAVEKTQELHAEAMRLLKEDVHRRANVESAGVTPEHGRQAARLVQVIARVAASMAPPEYREHLADVADGAGRVAAQPADRVWGAWMGEAGRFGRKVTGAPEASDAGPRVRADGSFESQATPGAPANDGPRYESGVVVPLGDEHARVQVVGTTSDPHPARGFGIVHGDKLLRARLEIAALLVLIPRRGAGTTIARRLMMDLAQLDPDTVVEGNLDTVCRQLSLDATLASAQSALERIAAISMGVRFHPIEKTWHIDRSRLEELNVGDGSLDIEIAR